MLGQGALESMSLGQLGSSLIRDTGVYTAAAHTNGKKGWGIIEAMVDTTFTTLTSGKLANNSSDVVTYRPALTNAFILKQGQRMYGFWTAITLATGQVMAYEI